MEKMFGFKIVKIAFFVILSASTYASADKYKWTQILFTDETTVYAAINVSTMDAVNPEGGTRKIVKAWTRMIYKRIQPAKSKQIKVEWVIDCNKGLVAIAQSIRYDKNGKIIAQRQDPAALMSMESPAPESLSFRIMKHYCQEKNTK